MREPFIFDINRCSVSDGPGIRTTVFFKGCNLDCFWCHNPEGKSALPELARFEEKCVGCGACATVCTSEGECRLCGRCVERCLNGARRIYGRKYEIGELVEIIAADKPYFDATGGGLTVSGGECMLYPEYVAELSRACAELGISVAVDTAGCVPYSDFEKVLPYVDLFLYDVKCLDPELHKRGTGTYNSLILQNLERLLRDGKRIMVRTPVIHDFNEGEELERIKVFCAERGLEHELLPYHSFGDAKGRAIKKH